MYSGLPVHLNPPLIAIKEEYEMDGVVVGLHWVQQNHENLFVIYNYIIISIVPMITTESDVATTIDIHMINNTRAYLTVPYNTPYNVSIVADLCGSQATTHINIHYGECNTYYVCTITILFILLLIQLLVKSH
jgi:hypothetical protein